MHPTTIFLEKMGAKQGCWNSTCSTTPIKVYHNTPFLTVKATSKTGKKIKVLQNNVALFGQLYISMQSRDGDLKEFFAHEIQSFPPSLSDFGKLHLPSTKSDILKCLEKPGQTEPTTV